MSAARTSSFVSATTENTEISVRTEVSAAEMVEQVRRLTPNTPYDAVSIGYPGLVFRGKIAAEPYNLGGGWVGFDFEEAFASRSG